MKSGLKSGKLRYIEKLPELSDGDTVKTAGFLNIINNEYILLGTNGGQQKLNLNGNILDIRIGSPYFVIGEMRNHVLFTRICRELIFEKYNLDFYLKSLASND